MFIIISVLVCCMLYYIGYSYGYYQGIVDECKFNSDRAIQDYNFIKMLLEKVKKV